MWCSQCQQDVPAVVSSRGEQRLCCPRCAQEIKPEHESPVFEPDWSVDEAQLNADLAELALLQQELGPEPERRSGSGASQSSAESSPPSQSSSQRFIRVDSAPGRPVVQPVVTTASSAVTSSGSVRSFAAWLFILLGTCSLFCGAALIGWSFYADSPLFWKLGLPIAIGGQAVLLMGVVLSLDVAAQTRQRQAEAIWQLQQQLQHPTQPGAQRQPHAPHPIVPSPHQLLAEMNARLQQ